MHRARIGSKANLGRRAGSRAIGALRLRAEEWKSRLSAAGAMTDLGSQQSDQKSAIGWDLAKSARMMPGIASSCWREESSRRGKEQPVRRVSDTAFVPSDSPRDSPCPETHPSMTALRSRRTG